MSAVVTELHISPARGIPMKPVDRIEVAAGHGIEGDRYRNSRHRHVSVQSADALALAAAEFGKPINPGDTRRNITVTGIDVPTKPGQRLTIGEVELEVVRIAAPCRLLDDVIGDGARVALRRKAGSIMRVLGGGPITRGDVVTAVEGPLDEPGVQS